MPLFRVALFGELTTKCLLSQSQCGFAGSSFGHDGSDKSWKMLNHTVSEDTGCLECYRQSTGSMSEHHDKKAPLGSAFKLKIRKISDINNSWICTLKTLHNLEYCQLANYSLLWKLFTDKLSILDFHLRYDFQSTAELKILCGIISSCSPWSL